LIFYFILVFFKNNDQKHKKKKMLFRFERGISDAILCLLDIFVKRSTTVFTDKNLALFYRGLEENITKNPFLMETVLIGCRNFFQSELKGKLSSTNKKKHKQTNLKSKFRISCFDSCFP